MFPDGPKRASGRVGDTIRAPLRTPYGWAAEALGNEKPNFAEIEQATNVGHWRPYYKLASHNVHSNPKGIFYKLGLLREAEHVLLVGASNCGLFLPGHSAAISLMQATTALSFVAPSFDSIVICQVMQLLCDELGESFARVQRQIEG